VVFRTVIELEGARYELRRDQFHNASSASGSRNVVLDGIPFVRTAEVT
jgi:hypothetical protein